MSRSWRGRSPFSTSRRPGSRPVRPLWRTAAVGVLASAVLAGPAGAWSTEPLTRQSGNLHLRVAVGASGDAAAVWSLDSRTFLARRPAHGSWGAPRPIERSIPGALALRPDGGLTLGASIREGYVVVDLGRDDAVRGTSRVAAPGEPGFDRILAGPDGATHLVGTGEALRVVTRPPGGEFGEPVVLSESLGTYPDIEAAVDGRGHLTVAWWDPAGEVKVATLPRGGRWSVSTVADRAASAGWSDVDLDVSPDGSAALAWVGYDARPEDPPVATQLPRLAIRPGPDAAWQRVPAPTDASTDGLTEVAVSRSAAGRVTLVWVARPDVVLAERDPGGGWSRPRILAGPLQQPIQPRIAEGDRGGRRVIVWGEHNGTSPGSVEGTAAARELDGGFEPRAVVAHGTDVHTVGDPVEPGADGTVALLVPFADHPWAPCLAVGIDHPGDRAPASPVPDAPCAEPAAAPPSPIAVAPTVTAPRARSAGSARVPVTVRCPATCRVAAAGRMKGVTGRATNRVRRSVRRAGGGRVALRLRLTRRATVLARRRGGRLRIDVRIASGGEAVTRRTVVRLQPRSSR